MENDIGKILESLWKQLETIKGMKNCVETEELLDSLICKSLKTIQEIRSVLCNNLKVSLPSWRICSAFSDPSIQFFGIDWDTLFSKCEQLNQDIAVLKETSCSTLLQEILCTLLTIENQILQHSVAVLSGNLGKKKLREQEIMQRRVVLMAQSKEKRQNSGKRRSHFKFQFLPHFGYQNF
jgi:hypothetical protein